MTPVRTCATVTLAATLGAMLAGCGTQGAPQPPSLNLPDRVTDLAAVRAGDQVSLTWTMPKRNTDKLPLKIIVEAIVCRREAAGTCAPAGDLMLAPGIPATFTETLPPALTSGTPRALTYFVELKNRNRRSAGVSNAAIVLAGAAPSSIAGLTAEMHKEGVALQWVADPSGNAVRLHRKLLTPPTPKPHEGALAQPPEPVTQNLLVQESAQKGQAGALDKNIALGQAYEYRAQRVARFAVDGNTLELAGELSSPVRVETKDVFPAAVPSGLAAVATAADPASGTAASIDLSWQPDSESNLAGYEVYRREDETPWRRISGPQPVVGPAFRDAQLQPGRTYHYAVSAISQGGNESGRSDEAQETVPSP